MDNKKNKKGKQIDDKTREEIKLDKAKKVNRNSIVTKNGNSTVQK